MFNQDEARNQQVAQSFAKILNKHGYGFQFSVLKIARNLANTGESSCLFEAVEFPVEVQGSGTRIDFILKTENTPHFARKHPSPLHILAECKRANPSHSNWCFVRAPYIYNYIPNFFPLVIEHFERREDGVTIASAKDYDEAHNPYHIGREVRTNIKGDEGGDSGRAIEDAASQISRGLNGYIETLNKNPQLLGKDNQADLLPVIFTTARLWVSEVDLSLADIESGNIDLSMAAFKPVSWLCYQYHLSPGLKHSISPIDKPDTIGEFMQSEYIRTIPIVSPSGIKDFLIKASWRSLNAQS